MRQRQPQENTATVATPAIGERSPAANGRRRLRGWWRSASRSSRSLTDVGRRRRQPEAEERQPRRHQRPRRAHMRQQHRQEDQHILGPLVQPDRAQPRLHRRGRIAEGPHRLHPRRTQSRAQAAVRIRHHRLHAMRQQRHIRPRISDVAEALRKPLLERRELVVPGQVDAAVGGQNPGKDAQMRGHALGQQRVRARGQVDLAALGMLLPQIFQQRLVVGQMHHIDRRQRRHFALERGLALRRSTGKMQQRRRDSAAPAQSPCPAACPTSPACRPGPRTAERGETVRPSSPSAPEAAPAAATEPDCDGADSKAKRRSLRRTARHAPLAPRNLLVLSLIYLHRSASPLGLI